MTAGFVATTAKATIFDRDQTYATQTVEWLRALQSWRATRAAASGWGIIDGGSRQQTMDTEASSCSWDG